MNKIILNNERKYQKILAPKAQKINSINIDKFNKNKKGFDK